MYLLVLLVETEIVYCDRVKMREKTEITDLLQYWLILEIFGGKVF